MDTNTLTNLKKTALCILTHARVQLLNNHPFIGNIAMSLEIVPTRDARCSTAMTDGKNIFFDIDFLSRLKPEEVQFVLGHEIWHVVMLHFVRGEGKEHSQFNIATDMEVNQILESDGFIPPDSAMFPNKKHSRKCNYDFPDGLSAEEYYDLLMKKAMNQNDKSEEDGQGQNGPGQEKNGSSRSKKDNGLDGQFDKHFDKNENQEKSLEKAMKEGASDKYGAKGKDDDFQPANLTNETQTREAIERVRESVVSSAQQIERTRGTLPDYIKRQVDKLLDPKMPWKELLAAFVTAGFDNRSNWNNPNRRFAYSGTYLPSHTGDRMRIAVGIDTSGSCEAFCQKFLTEVNSIAKTFGCYELHVIQCDTEVKDYTVYDENNPLDPANPIEFKGFGGTNLHPIFDYIELNDIDVDAAVVFTDGECEEFNNDGRIDLPVMWILTNKSQHNNLKIGDKVPMDLDD